MEIAGRGGGGRRITEMFLVMLGNSEVYCQREEARRPVSCMDQGAVGQSKKRLVEDRGAFAAMLHWCINSRKTRMIIRQAL